MKRCALILVILFACISVAAQTVTGIAQFSSQQSDVFDSVNLGSLNVHFEIPIVNKPGRGLPFVYSLNWDNSFWVPTTSGATTSWQPSTIWYGWSASRSPVGGYVKYKSTLVMCKPFDGEPWYNYTRYTYVAYVDRTGTSHPFNLLLDDDDDDCSTSIPSGGPFPTSGSATATDSSGYTLSATAGASSATITTKDGGVIHAPTLTQSQAPPVNLSDSKDTNGNKVTTTNNGSSFQDTLDGSTNVLSISGTNPVSYTFAGPLGNVAVNVYYSTKTVRTNFGCSGINEYGPTTASLPTSIVLPDGGQYVITYEQTPNYSTYVTGRISSITLPTGGQISYSYPAPNNGIACSDGSTAKLTRTTNPGGSWTYTRSLVAGTNWSTTLTDPASNQTVLNFQKVISYGNSLYLETKRVSKQGSTTPLQAIETCYNGASPDCTATSVTLPIWLTSVTTRLPDSTGRTSKRTVEFESTTGLPTVTREYDFGAVNSGTPGLLVRKSVFTYTPGLSGRPSKLEVFQGESSLAAKTEYIYDQFNLTATTAPQHDSVSGPRGNLTTIKTYANASDFLVQSFTYFDTGMVQASTKNNESTTTYTYQYDECGNGMLTRVNMPMNLFRLAHWDCGGGVQLWSKDENGQQTDFTYGDANRWLPTQVDFPDLGRTTTTYNFGTNNPWNTIQMQKIDASNSTSLQTDLDPFGRVKKTARTAPDTATIKVDTLYDAFGRVSSVTNPYETTGDPTYGNTGYTYDPLGRVIQVTNPDSTQKTITYGSAAVQIQDEGYNGTGGKITRTVQYDALGRMKSVCEITGGISWNNDTSASCSMDLSGNGFTTTYAYDVLGNLTLVTQGSLPQRVYAYDWLGRITSESNPESGNTIYSYYPSGVSAGNLNIRTRPAPNQTGNATVATTYAYDALHRLTGITYSDSTPTVTYIYDQTVAGGIPNLIGKGRLTEAKVSQGSISDTVFQYDPVGRIKAKGTCAPSNCTAGIEYLLEYTYDKAGNVLTQTGPLQNYTLTYSYNSAQQLTSLTSSWSDSTHPANLVTNMTYNPLGQVVSASYGNGVSLARAFDNMGRLRKLTDGSVYSIAGPVPPNNEISYYPNSNIKQAIDSANGNWTYGYDEFNRLASASISGGNNYTYDYDRYGNRWHQNVNGSASPSYTFTDNRIDPTNGITYDAAGNVINDGSHAYKYDAEYRLISVDNGATATYNYDALGNRIQTTVGSTTRDFIFDRGNRIAAMAAAGTFVRGEIFAGGWRVASYVPGPPPSTQFNHADWLGNVRVRTDQTGAVVNAYSNLPFGDCLTQAGGAGCNGSIGSTPAHFTDQDRDSESGLDHFMFRQYSSTQGRWMTSDPAGMGAVDAGNPQSWNRYAYVNGNPVNAVDPLGLETVCFNVGYTDENDKWVPTGIRCIGWERGDEFGRGPREFRELPCLHGAGPLAPGQERCTANNSDQTDERVERLKNCALAYYGIDPVSARGLAGTSKWGLIAAGAGGIPKAIPRAFGMKVPAFEGGSQFTSLLSLLSTNGGTAASGANTLRIIGRAASRIAVPVAIASAVIDAAAIGMCTADYVPDGLYTIAKYIP